MVRNAERSVHRRVRSRPNVTFRYGKLTTALILPAFSGPVSPAIAAAARPCLLVVVPAILDVGGAGHVGRFVVPPCTRHCSSRLAPPGLMTSANAQRVSAPLPRIGLRPTAFRFCARIATVEVDRRRQRHREMVVHRRGHNPVPAASRLPNCAARPGFRTDRGRQRDLEEGPPQGDCGRATLSRRPRASTSRPSGASPNGASSGASPSTRSSPWWSRPMSSSSPARSRRRASSSISPRSGCSPRPWHGYRTVWPAHKHDASTVVVLI